MRKIVAVSAFLALLCVSVVSADLVRPRKMDADEKIGPMTERFYVVEYKGNAVGKVIVSGDYNRK